MSDRRHRRRKPAPFHAPTLGQPELDDVANEFRCPCPECKGQIAYLAVKPNCCGPKAGLDVAYKAGTGILEIRCKQCGRAIMGVRVSPVAEFNHEEEKPKQNDPA
jgi:hypothetical protein